MINFLKVLNGEVEKTADLGKTAENTKKFAKFKYPEYLYLKIHS